jgi:hypothetical protein
MGIRHWDTMLSKKTENQPLFTTTLHPDRCERCRVVIHARGKANPVMGASEGSFLLCARCEQRNRDLLAAVQACIKLYGGMITETELLEMYDNIGRANQLFFDPFRKIREVYKGKDKLCRADLESWIVVGVIIRTNDQRLQFQDPPSPFVHPE